MTRIKRGVMKNKRRKNILKRAKGFLNSRSTNKAAAKEALLKAGEHAFRDRRKKKRDMRSIWLVRVNAALHENGTTWSKFADAMKKQGVGINRKVLSELAIHSPESFDKMVKELVK